MPVLVLEAPKPTTPEYCAALIARLPEAEIVTVKRVMIRTPEKDWTERLVLHNGGSYLLAVEEWCHMSYIAS